MSKFNVIITAVALVCASLFNACKKTDDANDPNTTTTSGTAKVNMHLTDGPATYDALWLNIQQVEVTMEGKSAVTIAPIRPGLYDLIKFRNGLDTLLLRADLPAGKISQIRLILGDGNTVVVDGQSYPLTTPSAQESGLKLNLNQEFVAGGSYDLWIDFDASKSVHQTGNGKYMLKPVIRAYSALTDGRIKGYVLPAAAFTTVYLSNGTDVYSAIPAADGYFLITGVPEGTYTVTLDADATTAFKDVVISNVIVKYGTTVDLGVTTLIP